MSKLAATFVGVGLVMLCGCSTGQVRIPLTSGALPEVAEGRPDTILAGQQEQVPQAGAAGGQEPVSAALSALTSLKSEGAGAVAVGAGEPSLIDVLTRLTERLESAELENEQLTRTVDKLESELAEKDERMLQLSEDLDEGKTELQKLQEAVEKWKLDVLGFRDEMREAEQAQIKTLKAILVLLEKLEGETTLELGPEGEN